MSQCERARQKARRYPSELQPNPDYQYELPTVVVINGVECIEVDAGMLTWARDFTHWSAQQRRGRG